MNQLPFIKLRERGRGARQSDRVGRGTLFLERLGKMLGCLFPAPRQPFEPSERLPHARLLATHSERGVSDLGLMSAFGRAFERAGAGNQPGIGVQDRGNRCGELGTQLDRIRRSQQRTAGIQPAERLVQGKEPPSPIPRKLARLHHALEQL